MSDNCDPPTGENDVEADEGPFVWDKSEPNVLERLEDWKAEYLKLASGSPTDNYISPMAARKVAEELADAIAEIKRLGKLVDELHCTNTMLRAITEAEEGESEEG